MLESTHFSQQRSMATMVAIVDENRRHDVFFIDSHRFVVHHSRDRPTNNRRIRGRKEKRETIARTRLGIALEDNYETILKNV